MVLASFAVFVLSLSIMLGLIQDFLAQEFNQFDEVASYFVQRIFGPEWYGAIRSFSVLGSIYLFGPLLAVTVIWICLRAKDKLLELLFLLWVVIGGEVLNESLGALFHRKGPIHMGHQIYNTFPSEETLTSLTVCGFSAFLLVRHYTRTSIRIAAVFFVILLCLLVGLSRIYFHIQFPSDVVAGYVFGGVWISLNVILLEIFRKLQLREVMSV